MANEKFKNPFAELAPRYWGIGVVAVPVKPRTKVPSITKWSSFQSNMPNEARKAQWTSKYGSHGIGILLGTEVVPGFQLAAIDVDDGKFVRAVGGFIGMDAPAKRGQKGMTFFALVPKVDGQKSTTFKGINGLGNLDILIGGRFTVVPPTIHPTTEEPYTWDGPGLLETELGNLPVICRARMEHLRVAVQSEHAAALVGGEATHEAGHTLVAQLVSAGASDDDIEALVAGLLPEDYSGNSLEELPGWIKSAREKGFDGRNVLPEYDPGAIGPLPLGYTSNGSFALRDQQMSIILVMSSPQLMSTQIQRGLALSQFWEGQFPKPDGGYSSVLAGEALVQACRNAGPFDPTTVRGRGVWMEKDQIIKNLGAEVPPGLPHTYLCFSPLEIDNEQEFEAQRFLELLDHFPWRHKQDKMLFLGWLAIAPICGVFSWRPHCFLYGPMNSGKTTLHNLASQILSPLCVAADGQSTEAGIRQKLGPDALPVILDEFETDQKATRLEGIIRLARSASSANSPVLRGTPEGNSIQFNIKTMFLWSAINITGMRPSDQSRILMLELTSHSNDAELGKVIERESSHFSDLGPAWCGHMANLAPKVLEGIEVFKAAMPSFDSRLKQNMATVLAAAFVALHAEAPVELEAERWVEEYLPTIERHGVANSRDDARECLLHLLEHIVRDVEGGEFTLGHWMGLELAAQIDGRIVNDVRDSYRILSNYGMRVWIEGHEQGILIRNGSAAIDKVFSGTRWANGAWQKAMGQIEGVFRPANPQRFPGTTGKHRSLGLPLELIPEPISNPALKEEF